MIKSLFGFGQSLPTLLFFLFLSLVLMVVDHRFGWFASVRHYIEVVPHAMHIAVRFPFQNIAALRVYFRERDRLDEENRRLNRTNAELSLRVQKLDSVKQQNERLRGLLNVPPAIGKRGYIVAELVRVAGQITKHRLILGKGANDGVYVGQPILNASGILGHVISVTPLTAVGILVTDADYSLQVRLERTGLRLLAVGQGVPNEFVLQYVPLNSDIRAGDVVLSSGLDDFYPPDYPVGRVVSVDNQSHDGFARIRLEPVAAANYSREVVLVGAPQ